MRKDTYRDYRDDMIRSISEKLEAAEKENALLRRENEMLQSAYDQMKAIHDTALEEYRQGVSDAREMERRLKDELKEAMIQRSKYEGEVNALLADMRKTIKNIAS